MSPSRAFEPTLRDCEYTKPLRISLFLPYVTSGLSPNCSATPVATDALSPTNVGTTSEDPSLPPHPAARATIKNSSATARTQRMMPNPPSYPSPRKEYMSLRASRGRPSSFRGASSPRGFSWTPDLETARKFARDYDDLGLGPARTYPPAQDVSKRKGIPWSRFPRDPPDSIRRAGGWWVGKCPDMECKAIPYP